MHTAITSAARQVPWQSLGVRLPPRAGANNQLWKPLSGWIYRFRIMWCMHRIFSVKSVFLGHYGSQPLEQKCIHLHVLVWVALFASLGVGSESPTHDTQFYRETSLVLEYWLRQCNPIGNGHLLPVFLDPTFHGNCIISRNIWVLARFRHGIACRA